MDELMAQHLAEHLQALADNVDYPKIKVAPVRVRRGDWRFHVTDSVGGDWFTESYKKVKAWLLSGA